MMDCQVDKAEARPRSTRIDEKVARAKEMIETTEILKGMKDVMNDMLARVERDRSSHGRTQRKQIRLSLDAIDKMAPTVAKNADSIAPVRYLKYACSREARKEKLKEKMLQDISNSVGRGQQNKRESSSLQNLEKLVHGDRKLNPIRLQSKKKLKTNGSASTGDKSTNQKKISCPVLPQPQNIGIYSPLETHSILNNLKGKERSLAIQKMLSDKTIPVSKQQV
jgi:hypothetical protein